MKPVIEDKINTVINNELIDIRTCTTIKSISGEPGRFNVTLLHSSSTDVIQVGSIVLATGWQPYNASRIAKFGYDQFKNVVTSIELEEMAKIGSLLRPSDQKPAESVLFIQCAGSRDQEHLPYCSSFCCGTTLKQATYIREFNKEANIFVIYKDIRMPGHYEQFYQEVQKDEQLFMTKGEVSGISENGEQLLVEVENTLIGEKVQIKVDLVVLAVGMTPSNSEDLNLEYRQGKGLPGLKYDFADSHFICFPYETRRTGIYAAGAVRAPMDISASITDAGGAMLKAIQTIESVKRGDKVHPRSGDQSYPQLYMERCTDCKRCTEECPFGAYDETEKGTPLPNPNRCRSCGICLGSCPERIINFDDFSIDSVSSMIKSVFIPDEFEEKPRILLFLCENDAYPAFDMAGLKRLKYSPYIRIIPVRCIGSVNKIWITDALNHGYDGILQIGCKPGDDYQCHFIQGSELSKTRAVNFQETLETMMLEPERVQTEFIEINEFNRVPEIINDYVELIEEIGPNPFKGL
jgi:quinone-modifying oxidoreductase subunit QmoB